MGEVQAHFTDMVVEEWEAAFRQAKAYQSQNLWLLDEHRLTEEEIAGTGIVVDVDEQNALLLSYRTACDILREPMAAPHPTCGERSYVHRSRCGGGGI